MPPNLFDKLLDALGLLPFGTVLSLRHLRTVWQRIEKLSEAQNKSNNQLSTSKTDLEHARDRIRTLAGRRDSLQRTLDELREERDRAKSGTILQQLARRTAGTRRALDQVSDDLLPAFDAVAVAESVLQLQEKRQRDDAARVTEVLDSLAGVCLPMALISCVAHTLGIDLEERSAPTRGQLQVDGEYARYDGSAMVGETVVLCHDHVPLQWTVTDGTGRFHFENLAPGEYTALALTDALVARRFTLEADDVAVELGPVESLPHLVRIRDEEGVPLGGLTVVLCGFSMERIESFAIGETQETGTVCLPRRIDLNAALLVYRVTEHGISLLHTDMMSSGSKPYSSLRITSLPLRAVAYSARTGEPIPDALVSAILLDGDLIAGAFGRVKGFRARTDASGAIDLYGPGTGRYLVTIVAPGFKRVSTEIVLAQDRSVHIGSYKLKPLKESGSLIGCIRDPQGRPSGGYVSLVRSNGKPTGYRTFADRYGNFSFEQLAPGEYVIEVQGNRPSELGKRKVTLHPNKRIEAIVTLRHSLEFEG